MGWVDNLARRILEQPSDPLRMQAFRLRGLSIEGLTMEADGQSLRQGTEPTCMYAFLNNAWIGTAYGSRFVPRSNALASQEAESAIEQIRACYLG